MGRKKKEDSSSVDAQDVRANKLASVMMGARDKYKRSVICSARDDALLVVPRVGTGIYGLDVGTNGGVPLCRVTMVYGEKSGGKTTLLLRCLSRFQQLCGNCYQVGTFESGTMRLPNTITGEIEDVETQVIVSCPCGKPRNMISLWIDAEGVWETSWPERMGVWAEKVMLMRPEYGEQGYDVIMEMAKSREIDLVVIDSLAAMTPHKETDSSMLENMQGVAARMNNRFIRLIVSAMNEGFNCGRPITTWLTNQYREKIGVMFGDPRVLPGGKGASFSTSLEIEMTPKKVTRDESTGEPLWGEFEYYIKRTKIGPPGAKGIFQQCMADTTDVFKIGDLMEHEVVIKRAVDMGFIDRPNQQTYILGDEQYRGISALIKYFGENQAEFEGLKEKMLRIKLGLAQKEE